MAPSDKGDLPDLPVDDLSDRDLLVQIHTHTTVLIRNDKDKERRIRNIEKWRNKVIGGGIVLVVLAPPAWDFVKGVLDIG